MRRIPTTSHRRIIPAFALLKLVAVFVLAFSAFATPSVHARVNVGFGQPCSSGMEGEACGPTADSVGTCQTSGTQLRCVQTSTPSGTAPVADRSEDRPFRPELQVPIPTVKLSQLDPGDDSIGVPWIADYIEGIHGYAVGAAAVVAAAMFMLGGIQYLTAGGSSDRVNKAKERIVNAAVGLLLVAGSILILGTFSADLVRLKNLEITKVVRRPFTRIPASQIRAATGADPIGRSQMLNQAMQRATELEGREFACFVFGSMAHESGGRMDALGHDENAAITTFSISMRRKFQNSGKFYSGKTFPPVGCGDRTCQNQGPKHNDDEIDLSNPPDYGLDWRFSHGFGSGQSTIFPNNQPCPGKEDQGRGFRVGGSCYTAPELLSVQGQIDAMITHYQRCWRSAGNGSNVARGYVCYAGTIAEDNPAILGRVQSYQQCLGGGGGGS